MAEYIDIKVEVEGKALGSVIRVFISQAVFDHHTFEVTLPMRSLAKIDEGEDPFPAIKRMIGKNIEINMASSFVGGKASEESNHVFKGIVTNLSVSGNMWKHGVVTLVGKSNTVFIDSTPNIRAYRSETLASIYKLCSSGHLSGALKVKDSLTYKDKLRYTVQYRESDFNFIKRLCFEYGEWFYFDGVHLCLGLDTAAGIISLRRHRLRALHFEYALASEVPGVVVMDYNDYSVKALSPKKVESSDSMAKHVLDESMGVFPGGTGRFVDAQSYSGGDEMQNEEKQLKHLLNVSNQVQKSMVMTISGESDMTEIKLGSVLKLEDVDHSGEFVVVQIAHNCGNGRSYSNQFKAIPKDSMLPSFAHINPPMMQSCPAIVCDNNDPKKMGRVKVKFDWSQDVDSPWIRMAIPHAGQDRGFYFLPEIGDEVMVGFEGGRAEHPYVIGTLYNGKNSHAANADGKNNLKSLKTQSGNEILFDDTGKLIFKNKNNTIELNTAKDGSIAITTNGDITISAAKNLAMSIGENMTVSVAGKLNVNVGDDMKLTADGKSTLGAGKDLVLEATGNMKASSNQDVEIKGGKNLKVSGLMAKLEGSTTAELAGGGTTIIKGGLVKIN